MAVPKRKVSKARRDKRDVQQFGSLTHLHFVNVLTAVSLLHHTRFARIAVIIRA